MNYNIHHKSNIKKLRAIDNDEISIKSNYY